MTHDIDFSIECEQEYAEIKKTLAYIGDKLISLGYIDSYEIKETISDNMSGGVKYKKNDVTVAGVDVGLHQLRYGIRNVTFTTGECEVFEFERMLADKISSILSRKRFRRIKDIYDLYCIITEFDIDFKKLKELTTMRLMGHEEYWDNIPFNETVARELTHAWDKLELNSFLRNTPLPKPDIANVLNLFYAFVEPLKLSTPVVTWKHKVGVWSCGE